MKHSLLVVPLLASGAGIAADLQPDRESGTNHPIIQTYTLSTMLLPVIAARVKVGGGNHLYIPDTVLVPTPLVLPLSTGGVLVVEMA